MRFGAVEIEHEDSEPVRSDGPRCATDTPPVRSDGPRCATDTSASASAAEAEVPA